MLAHENKLMDLRAKKEGRAEEQGDDDRSEMADTGGKSSAFRAPGAATPMSPGLRATEGLGTVGVDEKNAAPVLEMPELEDFRVQGTFRLWIATRADTVLPVSWLQECNKVVLEAEQGIKPSAIKTLHSTPADYMRACEELLIPFRQLYFAVTFYHAVLHERERFGALGWSRPCEFTQADHRISAF